MMRHILSLVFGLGANTRVLQQNYEDGPRLRPDGPSKTAHQNHEDLRRRHFWNRSSPSRRSSVGLEDGTAGVAAGLSSGEDVRAAVTRAVALRLARRSNGIALSDFASYHLPPEGTVLRIRNATEDVEETARSPSPPPQHDGDPSGTPIEPPGESGEREPLPELSDRTRRDDAASQSRRRENLLRASQRVAQTAKDNLFYPIRDRVDRRKTKKYVLNVATMQAAAIRYYQTMIVEYGAEMYNGGVYAEMPEILHKYCDALRDMDYMQEKARNGFEHDPFLLMTTKQSERQMMHDSGLISVEEMYGGLPPAADKDNPILPGVGRTARFHASEAKARLTNTVYALLSALSLIVPMVIMKLVSSQTAVLSVTCSFVISFALGTALWSTLKPSEVLGVTAGYAAVLVVFVGAQSGSTVDAAEL